MKINRILLLAAVSFGFAADDVSQHKEAMDHAQELKDDLKDALDAKAGSKAIEAAGELVKAGLREEAYWKKAKVDDAVKLARENLAAARQVSASARSGKLDRAAQEYGRLESTCRACHDLHPEKRLR